MAETPLVSICCITYNHEKYIRESIEGFLIQKTDFPIEIIIHDDASTDSTQDIIREFSKYDNRIIPILRENNIKSTGVHVFPFTYEKARGKYLALCEGDDYWTDPLKLQKQVEFMEVNKDCSLCFHATEYIFENEFNKNFVKRPHDIPSNNKFRIKDAILGGGGFMATNSMLFKTEYAQILPKWALSAPVGDSPLMLWMGMHGKLGYIDENMSTYRINTVGSWSQQMSMNWNRRKKHYKSIQEMWSAFDEITDYKYHDTVTKKKRINRLKFYKSAVKTLIRSVYS